MVLRMQPRITVITLGVSDLEKSFEFYKQLGFDSKEGIIGKEFDHGAVAFFELQDGLRLAIWERKNISFDTGIKEGIANPTAFTLGHNVNDKASVDLIMKAAEAAGAHITVSPHETFWGGYAGYFQDLDGHLWEIVYNPSLIV